MGMDIVELGYLCFDLKKLLATMEKAGMGKTKAYGHVQSLLKTPSAKVGRQIVPWDVLKLEADFKTEVATFLKALVADEELELDIDEEYFGVLNPFTLLSSTCTHKNHWWFVISDRTADHADELRDFAWPKSLGGLVELEFSYVSV